MTCAPAYGLGTSNKQVGDSFLKNLHCDSSNLSNQYTKKICTSHHTRFG